MNLVPHEMWFFTTLQQSLFHVVKKQKISSPNELGGFTTRQKSHFKDTKMQINSSQELRSKQLLVHGLVEVSFSGHQNAENDVKDALNCGFHKSVEVAFSCRQKAENGLKGT